LGNDATEAEGTPILTPGSTDVPFQALARTPGYFIKVPQRTTIIPKRPRKELVTYTVQAGDNLSTIAERFDVDTDTLIWANGQELEADPDYIVVGQKLIIPPVPGVLHTVKAGDTVESVAKLYKADPHAIIDSDFNKLSPPYTLTPGTTIMVPGGEKAYQPRVVYINGVAVMVNAPRGGGKFIWPTQGIITTFYTPDHRAIDIANAMGTPVYASSSGVVIFAGWYGTYGNTVIIDHGDGFQSLYAHLAVYYPSPGMNVRRGQAIGKMGSTGKSTGPHLHFEIHYAGGVVNPFKYLPQQ
jgi:murein DD-endopeptidase MepM/ murein hydrolase activator NlpD